MKGTSSKVLVFIVSVTTLAAAATVEIYCPVCGGAGTVPAISAGSGLRVVESRFVETYVGCPYEMSYVVSISVSNEASNATRAFLLIKVVDKEGVLQGEAIQEVHVDPRATKTIKVHIKAIQVRTVTDPPAVSASLWDPERRITPCTICQAKGKVSFFKWLILLVVPRTHRILSGYAW